MRLVAALLVLVATAAVMVGALVAAPTTAREGDAADSAERGEALYLANCVTCHGADGAGIDPWPGITNAGEAGADFQLRTGRMPHAGEPDQQAQPKPPAYTEQEIRDLVAYVAGLGDGPELPDIAPDESLLARGQELFAINCAPCHGASGNGGAVGGGAIAWPVTDDEPRIIVGAMLSGPGQMPVFDFPEEELTAIVTYVRYLADAANPGGFSIGGIGPVPEGFVAWLVGMALLALVVYLVGRRWDRKGGTK